MSLFKFKETANELNSKKEDISRRIAKKVLDVYLKNFDSDSFEGEKWQELSESTKKYKNKKGLPSKMLVSSGDLLNALTNSIKKNTFNETIIEVDNPYANYHNEGTNKLPKRQFIGITDEIRQLIRDELEKEYMKIIKPK